MITERRIKNKGLQMLWTVEQESVNIFEELITRQEKVGTDAEVTFYVNERPVGKVEVEDLTELISGVIFEINLQACPIVFDITVLVTTQNTDDKTLIITEEKKRVNLKGKYVSCGIQDKTSKIAPEFDWIGDMNNGITLQMTNDLMMTWKQFKPFYWDDLFILTITFEDYMISADSISLIEYFYDTLFSNCYCKKHHGDFTGVTRGTIPKCVFEAPDVVLTAESTATNYIYTYIVVAVTPRRLLISQEAQTGNAPGLDTSNFVDITWDEVPDATEYRVYRITTVTTSGGGSTITSGLIHIADADELTYKDDTASFTFISESTANPAYHDYLRARKYRWKMTLNLPSGAGGGTIIRKGIVTVSGSG